MIKKITNTSTAKKGRIAREIASIFSPETEDATNKTSPIGGVANPTVKFTDIMIAKCTGCTPRSINTGPKIGPRMIIAGPASKNIPTINRTTLIKNSKIRGRSVRPKMKPVNCSGAWLKLTTVLKATAAPTSNSTLAEAKAARAKIAGKSATRSVLSTTKAMNRA